MSKTFREKQSVSVADVGEIPVEIITAPPAPVETDTATNVRAFILNLTLALEAGARLTKNTRDDAGIALLRTLVGNTVLLEFAVGYIARWLDGNGEVLSMEAMPMQVQTEAALKWPDPTDIFKAIALVQELYNLARRYWT